MLESSDAEVPAKVSPAGMDRRARLIVVGLMGALLFTFVLIALLAPDPTQPNGRAGGSTILWRLLLLLVPLGIMYALLWGEKLRKLVKR